MISGDRLTGILLKLYSKRGGCIFLYRNYIKLIFYVIKGRGFTELLSGTAIQPIFLSLRDLMRGQSAADESIVFINL